MKTILYIGIALIASALFASILSLTWDKHDRDQCHYWYQAGLTLTPSMKQQCDYWKITK